MTISPLSLANVLTVLVAFACLGSLAQQSRGDVVRLWRLAVPPSLAVAPALMLLAGVFDATLVHDAEWVAAAIVGAAIGRTRGWSVPMQVDQVWRLVRMPPTFDATMAAVGLVILSIVDFVSAALGNPYLAPDLVAAAAAFCAGYIGGRAVALAVRTRREPHVGLNDLREASTHSA